MNDKTFDETAPPARRAYTRRHEVTVFVVEQVFMLRAKGNTNAEIGKALGIPNYYVTRIFNGRWPFTPACKEVADRLRNSLADA